MPSDKVKPTLLNCLVSLVYSLAGKFPLLFPSSFSSYPGSACLFARFLPLCECIYALARVGGWVWILCRMSRRRQFYSKAFLFHTYAPRNMFEPVRLARACAHPHTRQRHTLACTKVNLHVESMRGTKHCKSASPAAHTMSLSGLPVLLIATYVRLRCSLIG